MSETNQGKCRILTGFDGSDGARRALAWAATEARLRGATLKVVQAWTPGEFGTHEEMAVIAHKQLAEDVVDVIGEEAGIDVETAAEQGHAAKVLLQQAGHADMLVVGSRGHGGFTGLLLGSVGHQVSSNAGAPVVVIVRG